VLSGTSRGFKLFRSPVGTFSEVLLAQLSSMSDISKERSLSYGTFLPKCRECRVEFRNSGASSDFRRDRRPVRVAESPCWRPNYEAEQRRPRYWPRRGRESPQRASEASLEMAVELCKADMAGTSISAGNVFRSESLAPLAFRRNNTMPRNTSPCVVCVYQNATQLMDLADRTELAGAKRAPRVRVRLSSITRTRVLEQSATFSNVRSMGPSAHAKSEILGRPGSTRQFDQIAHLGWRVFFSSSFSNANFLGGSIFDFINYVLL
jgi:hypothetical protein